ncbi:MAG TPA: RluA family pseudouridine synthase [Clostridiales bacterium]|jgi:23S rRNA pseudouridine1911/1915/1917 synthase|nr:RluA family pseudouridine synthase [Clostridiales bacterium]
MELKFVASEKDEGRELLRVLRGDMALSAGIVRKLKARGGIFVNSRPAFTNHRLSPGDVVTCKLDLAEESSDIVPERGEVDIIYEDEWLLAVCKPSGQLSHPSRARYTGTLANYVSGYLGGVCHAVNRLDRDTSGIVLFAKSSYAKARAAEALRQDSEKEYLALAYGSFEHKEGTIDAPIKRLRERDMRRSVRGDGERAVTHYRVLGEHICFGEMVSALKLKLETGRTHQIRVHCEYLGHPLLGDVLYFTPESRALSEKLGINAQALHAFRLCFGNPFTGDRLELSCPLKRPELRPYFENAV